ncbi:hypothetical protein MKX01_005872 [Papaver californicum]|nr:hypothetical protein MKX01_005872 [Papaver californicum]
MDISTGDEVEGRIVVELYTLCTGEKGIRPHTGVPLHFKGNCFHRVVKGFMIQGGDISARTGTGGESIYGLKFEDENFEMKHERKGILLMANSEPNTNGSQFFITTTRAPHLDDKHVVFGKVVKGMGVVRSIEHVYTSDSDSPILDCLIADCGEIPEGADDGSLNFFNDGDTYPSKTTRWPLKKYRKGLRYLDICWDKEDIDEGDLEGALLDTDFALRDGEPNVKALFRQGQANMALNAIDAAVECFKKALELEPNDGAIKKELAVAKKRIADRRDQEKKAYSKMFG